MKVSPDGSRVGVAGVSGNLFMALMYMLMATCFGLIPGNAYAPTDVAWAGKRKLLCYRYIFTS